MDKTTKMLLGTITILLVIGALGQASSVILPIVISIFLALLLMPIIRVLSRYKCPLWLSSLLSLILIIGGAGLLLLSLKEAIGTLQDKAPFYIERATSVARSTATLLQNLDIHINSETLLEGISPAALTKFLGRGMTSLVSIVSNLTVIFFITLFILMESTRFSEKVTEIWGEKSAVSSSFNQVGQQVQRYMLLKTILSAGTGLLVWGFLAIVDIDFALLWGLAAFLLNFLPSVGSIIATIPPVTVALLQNDNPLGQALMVLVGLLSIQMIIGNVIDPRLLGKELNLSPLAVFLAMFFWGWLWGIVGMFLSVPLLVLIKVVALHSKSLTPIATMLEE
jgi:AI-2 transport protein TqsA